MIWFCGGHGACLTDGGPALWVEQQTMRWFERWLEHKNVVHRTEVRVDRRRRPGAQRTRSTRCRCSSGRRQGTGVLAVNPDAVSSGALIAATPSPLGLHLPITKPATGSQIVGAPKLTLSYSGQGTSSSAPVYAQIVDKKRNLVVGNMVTPIRLVLDGLPHTTTFTLEEIAASVAG